MVNNIYEPVEFKALADHYIMRDGYVFLSMTYPYNIFDAILIRYPQNAVCFSPRLPYSTRNLEEHIALINELKLEKAVIIAEDINFIVNCPCLRILKVIPAESCRNNFDYSPLYNMTELKSLNCATIYGKNEEYSTTVDYARIRGIEDVCVLNSGYLNYRNVKTAKSLFLSHFQEQDLNNAFSSLELDTLTLIQCKTKTLDGIQKAPKMQCLYLYYNRMLQDIGVLKEMKKSLRALRIENCPRINDFSVLRELENLELLELSGNNEIQDLRFLKEMKNLKSFIFSMNIMDGDLYPCMNLSYVLSKRNRKHYNLKDDELPKEKYIRGNENIEVWRRLE